MDGSQFDGRGRTFPDGARRRAVRVVAAVPVAGLLASLLGGREPARAGKKKRGKRGPQGPAGPAGTFGTVIKREVSAGSIAAGGTGSVSWRGGRQRRGSRSAEHDGLDAPGQYVSPRHWPGDVVPDHRPRARAPRWKCQAGRHTTTDLPPGAPSTLRPV